MNEIKKIKVVMVASKLDITGVSTVIILIRTNLVYQLLRENL